MRFYTNKIYINKASTTSMAANCGSFVLYAFLFTLAWVQHSTCSLAAPELSITNTGPNLSGNTEWLINVAPDATLFTNTDFGLGGSLKVELGIEIVGSDLLGATVNNADWPTNLAGNNPFTAGVSSGLTLDLLSGTLFASLLSNFFVTDTPVEVLTIETVGTNCTTVIVGGQSVFAGTIDEYESSLIAQAGQNFTDYQETITQPAGDFDFDCDVDGADFLAWQRDYSAPYTPADLAHWKSNFSTVAPLQAFSTTIPEPSTLWLLCLGLLLKCLDGQQLL